uniref:T-cell leukemia/lymphoma protein 1B n=1 Tax=Callospermophilus lateralis TaxID=76772 RepID=UPI004038DF35
MASVASPSLLLRAPPHRLCVQRPGIYRDEEGRSWVTVALCFSPSQRAQARCFPTASTREHSIRVHLWQIPVHPQGTLFFSQLPFSQLPLTWQLCPGKKYQGSDSRTWRIVDRDQASVWWLRIGATEQLTLMRQLYHGE